MKFAATVLISALCTGVARATYGSYGYGYAPEVLSPTYVTPYVPSPAPSPSPYVPYVPPSPVLVESNKCLPVGCPGDKKACPIASFTSAEIHDCCGDDYCGTCHYNGCNQCCPGSFKPSYAEPCIPCCEYDPNAIMCTDFLGSQQCAEGFVIKKDEATGWQSCV